jgi:hypothetical protein
MGAGTFTFFSKNKADFKINDIVGATVKFALVTSGWTPDSSVTGNYIWADISANEIAAGNGYTAGGVAPGSLAATAITGGFKFSSANPSWTASGGNIPAWRYVVAYISGSLWGKTNPLIGYALGDTTPADIPATSSGNPLTVNCPANGWGDLT